MIQTDLMLWLVAKLGGAAGFSFVMLAALAVVFFPFFYCYRRARRARRAKALADMQEFGIPEVPGSATDMVSLSLFCST